MPRITAPTLAEHRDFRRASLLAAGAELMQSGGAPAVTMSAVASRAGLSRTAVYEYFPSTADLLAAVLVEQMQSWIDQVSSLIAPEHSPEAAIQAYVRIALTMIHDGSHEIMALLAAETLSAPTRRHLGELHAQLAQPLVSAFANMGAPDPHQCAYFAQGVVEAAARRITATDNELSELVASATEFIIHGARPR
ncbi:MAG: hypothetical protein RJB01_24 [Actinomycetota bacterium]|jgi:AcrR family transcriptional regulator